MTKQLVDQLETFIKEKLQPNDKLPSERDLSELYHVSRNTVRSALNELFLRGFIYRSTGKGTFVAERFDERTDVSGSYSFTKQMLAMNRQPVTKIQRLEKIAVPPDIAKRMRVDPETPVYVLDRLRIADQLPMMIERSYLPALTVPDLQASDLAKIHYTIGWNSIMAFTLRRLMKLFCRAGLAGGCQTAASCAGIGMLKHSANDFCRYWGNC